MSDTNTYILTIYTLTPTDIFAHRCETPFYFLFSVHCPSPQIHCTQAHVHAHAQICNQISIFHSFIFIYARRLETPNDILELNNTHQHNVQITIISSFDMHLLHLTFHSYAVTLNKWRYTIRSLSLPFPLSYHYLLPSLPLQQFSLCVSLSPLHL